MRLNKKLIKYIVIPNMLFAISSLLGCMHTNSSNKIFLNNQTSFTLYTSKFETEDIVSSKQKCYGQDKYHKIIWTSRFPSILGVETSLEPISFQ